MIKQPNVSELKKEKWFYTECVMYPYRRNEPAYFKGAYFVPQYRLLEHQKFSMIFLSAYESLAYVWRHKENEKVDRPPVMICRIFKHEPVSQ